MKYAAPVFGLILLTTSVIATADSFDWPQWQGPDRNAISRETGLLQQWPEEGPPLAWRVEEIGGGYSAPAIAEGRIYFLSNRGDEEVVCCLSETDGSEIWVKTLGPAYTEGLPQGSEGPGSTPTVDGERLFVLGAGGTLACLQAKDGEIVWKRSLTEDFAGRVPMWRYNESPLVDKGKVIISPGGEETTIIAVDKTSGDFIWQTKVPESTSGESEDRGRAPGGRPSAMQIDVVLSALDADGDKEISAAEIDAAPSALAALDKNSDGSLQEDEVTPEFENRNQDEDDEADDDDTEEDADRDRPRDRGNRGGQRGRRGRGGRGGIMRFMPANRALDADESGALEAAELENAALALRTLDKNSDGKLVEDEVAPQFGQRGPSTLAGYASPIAIEFAGERQYVQFIAKAVVGISAADGTLLWRYGHPANAVGINCTTPIYHDGKVFASSAYGAGGGLVELKKDSNGEFQAEEVWFSTRMQNHHGGVVLHDGALYGANGGNGGGLLACLDFATGDVNWRVRQVPKGSLALADDRIFYRTEDDGTLVLIEPNQERYIEHGRFEQPDRSESPAWTHPVIANGKLYIRDQNLLLCYDVQEK